jgi:hypothetical protein
MTDTRSRVQMVRACADELDNGRLAMTRRMLRATEISSPARGNVCPVHGDSIFATLPSPCLDNYWSQQHLARLPLLDMWRLWRRWRKGAS